MSNRWFVTNVEKAGPELVERSFVNGGYTACLCVPIVSRAGLAALAMMHAAGSLFVKLERS